ncbi:DUF4097 family beta strand repeat-containing protein [Carboxylicivirga sp. M1479]|uniref:DUF4097 family beta strand repeat-containing protein n=1 Tax=Carboxylicivirga sp. M1479 TaxID=2594476 RepID=UPI00117740E7|nr:DUF4097 family beta strand repeat-containing protein [Carboxylicivirga sp. M1479]TRX71574.1 hypothetical protein FNN09_06265 [Carboxylicivirga sp. M1479]
MKQIYLWLLLAMPLGVMAQDMPVVAEVNQQFENVVDVAIKGEFCKVNVQQGQSVKVTGKMSAAKELDGYAINCSNEAGVLKVEVSKPDSGWTSHSGAVTVTVPKGVKVNIQTTSGYITLNGLAGNTVLAQSKSGKIVASDIQGDVTLKAKSASIKVNNITGQVSLTSKGGEQVARNIKGALSLYTSGGNMLVENIDGSLKTESTDGSQTIKGINGDIYLKTKSGAMKLSEAKGSLGTLSASGTLNLFDYEGSLQLVSTKGSVIGARVKLTESSNINTTEGKIKIKFVNPKEELSFLCESQHAYMVAFGKSKKRKLKWGDGPILVTAVSTTGAHNYY